jgi:hypothetical protein
MASYFNLNDFISSSVHLSAARVAKSGVQPLSLSSASGSNTNSRCAEIQFLPPSTERHTVFVSHVMPTN